MAAYGCCVGGNQVSLLVLFVSVSFLVLIIISLIWLLLYYVQRFRFIHNKVRLLEQRNISASVQTGRARFPILIILRNTHARSVPRH